MLHEYSVDHVWNGFWWNLLSLPGCITCRPFFTAMFLKHSSKMNDTKKKKESVAKTILSQVGIEPMSKQVHKIKTSPISNGRKPNIAP